MSILNIKQLGKILEFQIAYTDTSIANTIRRILTSAIPTYSVDIDSIKIKYNNTIFHNEKISHLLTLIPIKNYNNELSYNDVVFSLDEKYSEGNVNSIGEKLLVMSNNIKSSDGKQYFIEDVPIVELRSQQKIKIDEFKLKLGILKTHSQFQSCLVRYEVLNIDDTLNENGDVNIKLTIEPCAISSNGEEYPYSANDVLIIGLNLIITKLRELEQKLDNIQIDINSDLGLSKIILDDEDHTMGNLLTSIICEKNKDKYCAYKVLHPLKRIVEINMTDEKPKQTLGDAIETAINIFEKIKKSFVRN